MAVTLKSAPRKARTKKPAPVPVPVCNTCFKRLNWRDTAYCGGANAIMCKTCHQKSERKRLHGVYVPRDRMPHPAMAYGAERTAKLTAKPAWKAVRPSVSPPATEKAPRWVRSEKRAERYIRRKAKKAQRAA